jgi:uncharacterized protein YceK
MKIILIALFSLLLIGCGTMMSKQDRNRGFGTTTTANDWGIPYSGVRSFNYVFIECKWEGLQALVLPFYLIDLPISFVADTLLLPIDIVHEVHPYSHVRTCPRLHM